MEGYSFRGALLHTSQETEFLVFEHLLGSEIFETDDIAVDMRELARKRNKKNLKK